MSIVFEAQYFLCEGKFSGSAFCKDKKILHSSLQLALPFNLYIKLSFHERYMARRSLPRNG
jgi:hypothetical protein